MTQNKQENKQKKKTNANLETKKQTKQKQKARTRNRNEKHNFIFDQPKNTRIARRTVIFIRNRKKQTHMHKKKHKQNKLENKTITTPRPLQETQRTTQKQTKNIQEDKNQT